MDKIVKFLLRLSKKERALLSAISQDILELKLKNYYVKPLEGYKGIYRLRKGKVRIVFCKDEGRGIIIDVDFRKDVYKNL